MLNIKKIIMSDFNKKNIEIIINATGQILKYFEFNFGVKKDKMDFGLESLKIVDDILNKSSVLKKGGLKKGGYLEKGGFPQLLSLVSYIGATIINNKENITVLPDDREIDLFFLNQEADIDFVLLTSKNKKISPYEIVNLKIQLGHSYSIFTSVVNFLND